MGYFRFYRKTWRTETGLSFDEIESRPCSREDFNWGNYTSSDQDALFYPAGNSQPEIESNWDQL